MDTRMYPNTKALLSFLLANFPRTPKSRKPSRANSGSDSTSPKLAALTKAVRDLAVENGVKLKPPGSLTASASSSSASESEPDDSSSAASDSGTDSIEYGEQETDEEKMNKVLKLLQDDSIDEDDKPEALKTLLTSLLSDEPLFLDPQILALLHRYQEDLNPSGTPVPPLTPLRSASSLSRSSSFRHNLPSSRPSLSRTTSRAATPTPAERSSRSSSPFRSASPVPLPLPNSARHTPQGSPWSSPRPTPLSLAALSARAPEFKFSAGASEFQPTFMAPSFSASSSTSDLPFNPAPGTPSATSSRPGTPSLLSRPIEAQALWASTSSPLGTPKHSQSHTNSALSSPSYFPRHLDASLQRQMKQGQMTRLPWTSDSSNNSESEDAYPYDDEDDDEDDEDEYADLARAQQEQQAAFQAVAQRQASEWGHQAGGGPSSAISAQADLFTATPVAPTSSWDPFEQFESDPEAYTTPSLYQMDHPGQEHYDASAAGLGSEAGAYVLTPFDHLHSVFAGSDVSAAVLEEALVMTGFDVDQAIEYIIDTQPGGPNVNAGPPSMDMFPPPQPLRTAIASGSRPLVVSRDSFDGFVGGNGGRGSNSNNAQRWPGGHSAGNSRPQTPTAAGGGGGGAGVGGRVCRYYLSGNCLRSDCKFSHDVGKAVCKFWLRGHCLKGDERCDFLHSIPPIMRADFEQRAQRRSENVNAGPQEVILDDSGPDLDFPTLGEAPRSRRPGQHRVANHVPLDPTRTRFSGAVKFGNRTVTPSATASLPRGPPSQPIPSRDSMPQPRFSARINLRPPALLPTLPTGAALNALYTRYRSSFLELGANRNKCLARAAECWKKGDGAGARKWSRDAADWNRQVAIEGRDSAERIVAERRRVLKEAIGRNEGRAGTTEDVADRKARGQERGGGVCLGVVAQAVLPRGPALTVEERTEIALDLHGLHFDEASTFLGDFLLTLERERFAGLAYIVIGQAKHTGSTDADRGAAAGRLRLEQGCTEFLSSQGWPWSIRSGIIAVDALR